ncbi:hypothetical protein MUO14_24195 [Halobacillus shinanisalinarum]|uniref:TrbC/VIRB2 family protein n=1 Tax=Halobacillus shinanisalinarum TaxID=2932258 RepID=A0ABY4GZ10_9BACI|nr:hypothetical protein [Halobacillus shinanisalinarum]UOQ93431.1 hypothetical protein MUO14_24195 [Halobacillus shinanisalinarum]
MAKTEAIPFGDFMSGDYKRKKKDFKKVSKYGLVLPAALLPLSKVSAAPTGEVVAANAVSDAIKGQIVNAFDPVVELMIALSLPIAGVMITGGALMVMIGMNDRGYGLLMKAGIGYVLVQMSPLFIDLLAGVGAAV